MKKLIILLIGILSFNIFAQDEDAKKDWSKHSTIEPYYEQLIQYFKEKKYDKALEQQKIIFDVVDKHISEDSKSFRRLGCYTVPTSLMRNNALTAKERIKIFNYVLKGFFDNKIEHVSKNKLARGLMRHIKKSDIDADNKKMITKAFKDKVADNNYFVQLIYLAEIDGVEKYLETLSKIPIKTRLGVGFRNGAVWEAKFILAVKNREKYTERVLKVFDNVYEDWQTTLLFDDLIKIKDKKIVEFLNTFLESNKRMPKFANHIPAEPYATRAALALSKMLEGFPQGEYNDEKVIKKCKKWLKQQKEFKFK